MTYLFRYKRRFFFRSIKVIGHNYRKDIDRMVLYLQNGSIHEIAGWSKFDCKLGTDWVLAVKKEMEKKAGQPVNIDRDLDAK